MGRARRVTTGGLVYHVLNRACAGNQIFADADDYAAFEQTLAEAGERVGMRLLAYCVMPNHWHLVLWPTGDGDLSRFTAWLGLTHTQRWHAHRGTAGTGPLYQGRFKSFVVQSDAHLLTVCRYVERNPLRAGLVTEAGEWRWSSLWRRRSGSAEERALLSEWPVARPADYEAWVNRPETPAELASVRRSVAGDAPFGDPAWLAAMARQWGRTPVPRPRGRPRKQPAPDGS